MKDIERWLKKGLIDENLAEILNTDLKEEAEKEKQYSTSSLIDGYILEYSKILWMLNQSI